MAATLRVCDNSSYLYSSLQLVTLPAGSSGIMQRDDARANPRLWTAGGPWARNYRIEGANDEGFVLDVT